MGECWCSPVHRPRRPWRSSDSQIGRSALIRVGLRTKQSLSGRRLLQTHMSVTTSGTPRNASTMGGWLQDR
eukprot:4332738-Heterocapsa_arctica.AAC.1